MNLNNKLISDYNYLSSQQFARCAMAERECFAPVAFKKLGAPTVVSSISELPFFVCSMQEGRARDTLEKDLNGLSDSDIKILSGVINIVVKLTENLGMRTAPRASLLRHFFQYKLLSNYYPSASKVLEIGPGSGYLSLILARAGFSVMSYELTQAFYLYQTLLFHTAGCLDELYRSETGQDSTRFFRKGRICHVPWWKWKTLTLESDDYADLITVNHAICEMHPYAVQQLLAFAVDTGSPPFLLEGSGAQGVVNDMNSIKREYRRYGYRLKNWSLGIRGIYIFERQVSHPPTKVVQILQRSRFGNIVLFRILQLIPFHYVLVREYQRILHEVSIIVNKLLLIISGQRYLFPKGSHGYSDFLKIYLKYDLVVSFRTPNESFFLSIKEKSFSKKRHDVE